MKILKSLSIFIWVIFSLIYFLIFLYFPNNLQAGILGFGIGMFVGSIGIYLLSYLLDKAMLLNRKSFKLIELQRIKIAKLQGRLI